MSASLSKVKTTKRNVTLKRILQNRKKRIRLFFLLSGILFIGLGFYLSGVNSFSTSSPKTDSSIQIDSIAEEPIIIDKSLLKKQDNHSKSKNPPIRLLIPDLDINLSVKEAKVVNGFWEVFSDKVGFGLGSSYPDEGGNSVIFAHAREGLFLPLKKAKVGQIIYLLTVDKWYAYKIMETKVVLPSQVEVIAPTKESILTLYTCSGFADSKRLIVIAKLI